MDILNVFAINLKKRMDRRTSIVHEFSDKPEFKLHIIEGVEQDYGPLGLWQTICKIVKERVYANDDYFILCEDDHIFTDQYNVTILIDSIKEATKRKADILSGGVSWSMGMLYINEQVTYIEKFTGMQFTVIFRNFYDAILNAKFTGQDNADLLISSLSNRIFVTSKCISVQRDFGYSDVTPKNNEKDKINTLFEASQNKLKCLSNVSKHLMFKPEGDECNSDELDSVNLPVYVINLKKRTDRRIHIESQFKDRPEFNVIIVDACEHDYGHIGLWNSLRKVIEIAIQSDDDVIVVCEDDHTFTEHYNKQYLISNILEAHEQGCDILAGGIGGCGSVVPITKNRYWTDWFWCLQFTVIFKKFFRVILNESCDEDCSPADNKLSEMTGNKMILHPFISVQTEFGYSDATERNNKVKGLITSYFQDTNRRFENYREILDSHVT
ncbi:glycosyltransferase family 25 protein [Chitinophaga rhizosphaerae]|uniref:hypothetical protein n=1 Tax=Chitinophaga rhizosphaerae TaxID=1864947 RepID=UPI001F0CB57F|nr:hypothetical protein [Chitinophaga rhizosphaerae]